MEKAVNSRQIKRVVRGVQAQLTEDSAKESNVQSASRNHTNPGFAVIEEDIRAETEARKTLYRLRLAAATFVGLLTLEGFLCWKAVDLMQRFDKVLEVYQSSHDNGIIILYGVMSFSLILGILSIAIGMLNVYSTRKSKKANTTDLIKAIKAIKWQK